MEIVNKLDGIFQFYNKRLREAAKKLGKSKRTVQRLVKKWEEEGLAGLTQTKRSDKGSHRISDKLEKFTDSNVF